MQSVTGAASDATLVLAYASIENDRAAPEPRADDVLVEAKLSWGGDALAVVHVAPRASLRVRDIPMPASLPRGDLEIARVEDGRVSLVLPSGARVPDGCRMALRLGRAVLRVSLVTRTDVVVPKRAPSDGRLGRALAGAAALHAIVAALAIVGRAGAGDEEREALLRMEAYLAAADERATREAELAVRSTALEDVPVREQSAEKRTAPDRREAAGLEGTRGTHVATKRGARARDPRGIDPRVRGADREPPPSSFGLLEILLGDGRAESDVGSPFAAELPPIAMGNLFGATLDDAVGAGGLGLSGPGEGGGGKGAGVGLGAIASLSGRCAATCTGSGQGFGQAVGVATGAGRLGGSHTVRSASLRCGELVGAAAEPRCDVQVSGRLPAEAVQRIVRQSFGRLRGCYEAGLSRDPGLEGRIAVKFVIDRAGEVAMVTTDDRSLPDPSVAACVARAFRAMSFPEPAGGIVTVVYPVVFSTST